MIKKIIKKARYFEFVDKYPRLTLGTCIVVLLCSFLMVMATFTRFELFGVNLSNPFQAINGEESSKILSYFDYIPQIPAAMFIGALLGPRFGIVSILIYFLAGILGFPVFAMGGGVGYFTKVGFGYVIGYFMGTFLVGYMLRERKTHFQVVKATLAGVLSVHIFGIIYLVLLMFFKGEQLFLMLSWIWLLSGMQILYDLLISFVAIYLARPIRSVLWIAMD